MKGVMFLILTICIFCVGGMYHSRELFVLAFVQGTFLFLGILQVLYCKRKLTLRFCRTDGEIGLGQSVGGVEIENKGRIPVSCFQIELTCSYHREKLQEKHKVYGSIETGKSVRCLAACAPHCGILTVHINLRGFSGGDYKNSEWKAADDDALLRNVVETLQWQQWLEMVRGMYYSMYFLLSTDLSERIDPDIRLLSVHPVGEDFHTFYMPYCSRWNRWNGNPQERSEMEYYFEYYQQEDVSIICGGAFFQERPFFKKAAEGNT